MEEILMYRRVAEFGLDEAVKMMPLCLFLAACTYWFAEILGSGAAKRSNLCPSHRHFSNLIWQHEDQPGCLMSPGHCPSGTDCTENGGCLGHLQARFPRAPCNCSGKELKNLEAEEIYE